MPLQLVPLNAQVCFPLQADLVENDESRFGPACIIYIYNIYIYLFIVIYIYIYIWYPHSVYVQKYGHMACSAQP